MKKLIAVLFAVSLLAFAEISPWAIKDASQLDQVHPNLRAKAEVLLLCFQNYNEFDNYEQFKDCCLNELPESPEVVVQITACVPEFYKYFASALADNDIPLVNRVGLSTLLREAAIRDTFIRNNITAFLRDVKVVDKYVVAVVDNFIKNSIDMDEALLKLKLKQIKRVVYPKIDESDDWKKIAVKIQLVIDSLD